MLDYMVGLATISTKIFHSFHKGMVIAYLQTFIYLYGNEINPTNYCHTCPTHICGLAYLGPTLYDSSNKN